MEPDTVTLVFRELIANSPIGAVLAWALWELSKVNKKLGTLTENNVKAITKLTDTVAALKEAIDRLWQK